MSSEVSEQDVEPATQTAGSRALHVVLLDGVDLPEALSQLGQAANPPQPAICHDTLEEALGAAGQDAVIAVTATPAVALQRALAASADAKTETDTETGTTPSQALADLRQRLATMLATLRKARKRVLLVDRTALTGPSSAPSSALMHLAERLGLDPTALPARDADESAPEVASPLLTALAQALAASDAALCTMEDEMDAQTIGGLSRSGLDATGVNRAFALWTGAQSENRNLAQQLADGEQRHSESAAKLNAELAAASEAAKASAASAATLQGDFDRTSAAWDEERSLLCEEIKTLQADIKQAEDTQQANANAASAAWDEERGLLCQEIETLQTELEQAAGTQQSQADTASAAWNEERSLLRTEIETLQADLKQALDSQQAQAETARSLADRSGTASSAWSEERTLLCEEIDSLRGDLERAVIDQELFKSAIQSAQAETRRQAEAQRRRDSLMGAALLQAGDGMAEQATREAKNHAEMAGLRAELDTIYASKSWKVTQPMRAARRGLTTKP